MTLRFADVRRQVEVLGIAERCFDAALLFALHELGLFVALADGPRSADALQAACGGDARGLAALLDGAVATGLLTRDGEAYAAPEALVACLGRPDEAVHLGEWLTFLAAIARPLGELGESVRSGRPAGSMVDGQRDDGPARAMTAAMDAYARTRGAEFVERLDVSGVETLLDVGCGPATYSLALVEKHPGLTALCLDLPGPIERARAAVEARGLGERARLIAADAFDYRPDRPVQLILVSNVLHMLGPSASPRLLAHLASLLEPGGRLVVQAEFLDAGRTSPRWPALLNVIMAATTEEGRNHDVAETSAWMEAAGLVDVVHTRLSPWNVNSLLTGTRPAP